MLPGQSGTKRWMDKYKDSLVCVRYRDDEIGKRRLTTIELIVKSQPLKQKKGLIPKNKIILLRIHLDELHLRNVVKGAGGRWNREKQAWELPYGQAQQLGLENRMIPQYDQY